MGSNKLFITPPRTLSASLFNGGQASKNVLLQRNLKHFAQYSEIFAREGVRRAIKNTAAAVPHSSVRA